MSTPEGLCTRCSATQQCDEHRPPCRRSDCAALRERLATAEAALTEALDGWADEADVYAEHDPVRREAIMRRLRALAASEEPR